MSLPGKLSIGILEEDNPLRSYFRYRPLLVDEDGRYAPYAEHAHYPDEGSIRIVPDKNESYHFKTRMRQIGLFSVVDLRAHPNESDKIRPNKNYRPESEEINASIIYSDVVRAPAPDMILEILPAEAAEKPVARPHTPEVLLRGGDGPEPEKYIWKPLADSEELGALQPTGESCDIENMQVFELPGFREETLAFAIRPASSVARVSDMPEYPAHREEPSAEAGDVQSAPDAQEARAPRPAAEAPAKAPEAAPRAAEKPRCTEELHAGKPWLHHDDSIMPAPVDRHLSRADQLLAAQAGLNPRRGRSLQELIDEKWQRSRLNQLGQPVSPIATGAPVPNPVDAAVKAVGEAWENPQLQGPLMDALGRIEGFSHSVNAQMDATRQAEIENRLNELEAQRLKLSDELEKLKAAGRDVREKLKHEILQDADNDLAEARSRVEAARAEQARQEREADDARAAAEDAKGLLDSLAGQQLEDKIRDIALTRRVLERLELLRGTPASVKAKPIGLGELIDRVMARFQAAGMELTKLEAANLCACLAVSPALMLSGAPGSGKTATARLLADALGLAAVGRAPVYPPAAGHHGSCAKSLRRNGDAPAVIVLDDANLSCGPDVFRGLLPGANPGWRVIATLQDVHSGHPLSASALDQGFLVRLSPRRDAAWKPAPIRAGEAFEPADIGPALDDLRAQPGELPEAIVRRMEAFCRKAADLGAEVSRRALTDAWLYCSAMLGCLGGDADPEALLDLALSQRVLPSLIAAAPAKALSAICDMTRKLPRCQALLTQPVPIMI